MFLLTNVHNTPLWQKQDLNSNFCVVLQFPSHTVGGRPGNKQFLTKHAQSGSLEFLPISRFSRELKKDSLEKRFYSRPLR